MVKTIVLLKDIYEGADDYSPASYLAFKGEILEIVDDSNTHFLSVRHSGNKGSFKVYDGEYEWLIQ